MSADKFILPEISAKLAQTIEIVRAEQNLDLLFLVKQNAQGLISEIISHRSGPIESIFDAFSQLENGHIVLFCRHTRPLHTTEKDEEIAHFLAHQGIGLYLLHPTAQRLRCLNESSMPSKNIQMLDMNTVAAPLQQGGALSKIVSHYESRETQIALLKFIAGHFNENTIGIAEGGTGVGKSFAYLIPAIGWAVANQERIVISTATIALQQQLINKDIPLVKRMLGSHVKAVLIKGKQNYLCLHHLFEIMEEEKLFLKEDDPLRQIADWAEETKTGDKADLPFLPPEDLWARLSGDTETCLGAKCPFYQKCFIFQVRKEATQAQLLIVNHHLFFADLVLRHEMENAILGILPPFRKVIFDEAHQIESSATHFFSSTFSRFSIQRQISRLIRRRGQQEIGLLAQIAVELPASEYHNACVEKTRSAINELRSAIESLHIQNMELHEPSFRLYERTSAYIISAVLPLLQKLFLALSSLSGLLKKLYDILNEVCMNTELISEFRLIYRRLTQLTEICQKFVQYHQYPNEIFWAEQRKNRLQDIYYVYMCTPLNIAMILDQYLYKQNYTVIMVSATLTFNQKFDFFLQKIGLASTQRIYSCASFASPFDYYRHCLFCIPKDIPSIEIESSFYTYSYELLLSLLHQNPDAGMLILFTSYKSLRDCAEYLQDKLTPLGRPLFKQGDADRSKLIENFIRQKPAVLLGTDSFWEGIDIDNLALKILVIFRLPFQSPNNPLIQSKQEVLEKQGKNPFMELQVPDAAIKLKQGFGRLMRKSSDFGAIVLLDNRIIKKQYGTLFLQTLPQNNPLILSHDDLLEKVSDFLKQDFSQPLLS